MPIVTVQMTRERTVPDANRTADEQKATIYKGISDLLYEVMEKIPTTLSLSCRIELADFGRGYVSVPEYRAKLTS